MLNKVRDKLSAILFLQFKMYSIIKLNRFNLFNNRKYIRAN